MRCVSSEARPLPLCGQQRVQLGRRRCSHALRGGGCSGWARSWRARSMKADAALRRRRAGRWHPQRPRCSGDPPTRRRPVQRRPGVRLARRVASTAEGVWQGGTVIAATRPCTPTPAARSGSRWSTRRSSGVPGRPPRPSDVSCRANRRLLPWQRAPSSSTSRVSRWCRCAPSCWLNLSAVASGWVLRVTARSRWTGGRPLWWHQDLSCRRAA
jgi:hypothetical protein